MRTEMGATESRMPPGGTPALRPFGTGMRPPGQGKFRSRFCMKQFLVRRLFLLCASVLLAPPLAGGDGQLAARGQNARPGVILGQILTQDGSPLGDAEITLTAEGRALARRGSADAEGRFQFPSLPPGGYRIRVKSQGFAEREEQVELGPGESIRLTLNLKILPRFEQVTVTATRSEQKLADVPDHVSVITSGDLKRSPALTLDDALRRLPSFSLFRRTSSLVAHPTTEGVSLRGVGASGASRTLVLLDGVPHNDAFGNWVYWSKIPKSEVEKVEVEEGGVSNLYGSSAMAGVINITTRAPEDGLLFLEGQAGNRGTGDLDAYASRKAGPVILGIGGRVFRTGGYTLVQEENRGPVDVNATSRAEVLTWRADYSPAPGMTLIHHGRLFGEKRNNGTPLQENSTRELYLGGGLRAGSQEAGNWQANVFSHVQTFESSFSSVAPGRAAESLALLQDVPSKDLGGNVLWARRFPAHHEWSAGAETRWVTADNNEDVFVPSGRQVRSRFIEGSQVGAGIFLQDFYTPAPRLVISLGGRIDFWRNYDASRTDVITSTGVPTPTAFPRTSETSVSPRAGALYRLTDSLSVRGAYYRGFRAPTLNELYRPFRVGNVQTNENPELGPERLAGGEAGFNYSAWGKVFWRMTGFWNSLRDPISNVTQSVSPELIIRQRQNLGRLRVRGIESEIEFYPAARWSLAGAYVFNEALVGEFAAQPELQGKIVPQVPRHRASLTINHDRPGLLYTSLQVRYESLRFDDDLNQSRLPGFWVVDVSGFRPLPKFGEVFVGIQNILNQDYTVQASPVPLRGLPFMITAGLRFRFARR